MANWYCDPSLPTAGSYNAAPVAAGTVPTKPDEGDGKASGVATMASGTITIGTNLNSGDTVSFNGKTFTAGTDFTIGGDAATTATNLRNAINGVTATSTWTVGNGYQFRDLFNACVSSNVVTVYTRIGSADWNSITIATSSGGRATVSGFSGGASGAFGWAINTGALAWPSGSKAIGAYGLLVADPVGYVIANGDLVNVRCGDGSAGITLTLGNVFPVLKKRGTPTLPVTFLFDDGTVWSADSGDAAQLMVRWYNSTNQWASFGFTTAASSDTDGGVILKAKRYSNGTPNFKLQYAYDNNGVSSGYFGQWYLGAYVRYKCVGFEDARTTGTSNFKFMLQGYGRRRPQMIDCELSWGHSWGSDTIFECVANQNNGVEVSGGKLAFSNISSAPTGPFIYQNASQYDTVVSVKGLEITGLVPGAPLFNNIDTSSYQRDIEFIDCDGLQNFNLLQANSIVRNASSNFPRNTFRATGIKGNGFAIDSPKVNVTWLPGLGFPYLNGIVENNQPASLRAEYSVNSKYVNINDPAILLDTLVYNASTTAATKTLTMQIAVDENLSLDTSMLALHVEYQDDTTGKTKYLTTLVPPAQAASLTASTDTWYPEDGGRPYYTETVAKYYNKKKLTLTTPTTVKAQTQMRVWLSAHVSNTATGRYLFIDPYIQVS